jgi:PadR family transcriptional regulator, regulatory protein PadR
MRGEALKSQLELLLLATLDREPAHGYLVVERLKERSGGVLDVPEGSVYPALYRLERSGLISSKWSRVDGRRRRIYKLTRRGRSELAVKRDEWKTVVRAMRAVLA